MYGIYFFIYVLFLLVNCASMELHDYCEKYRFYYSGINLHCLGRMTTK